MWTLNRLALVAALLSSSLAYGDGISGGVGQGIGGGISGFDGGVSTTGSFTPTPPSGNFLLADTGVVLLVNTGNKFLVQ